ncbi:MAG: hypothetical protein HPY69_02275 [Armatimonadetes bacterium]|nr:hypothetical protein [Armatimonadota bacterium]
MLDDGDLTPVSGARVVANTGQTDTTDSNGQFSLQNVPAGARTITVAADGYQTAIEPISYVGGGLSVNTVYLRPALLQGFGQVTGVVTEAGSAASGASVQAGGKQALTKSDGSYTLYNVPIGRQTVMAVSADGQTSGSATVTVTNQASVTANITLSNSPPPPPPL